MPERQNPRITVTLDKQELNRGEMLRVSVSLTERVPELWMRILNKDSIVVQKAGLVGRDTDGLTMMVGTKDLDEEFYTIQFSNHLNFSPIGVEEFRVRRKILPLIAPLLLPGLGLEIEPEDQTEDLEVEKLKFTTMKDSRVDSRCKEYEDTIWDADDPDLPEIPVHFNCRCWYQVIKSSVKRGCLEKILEPIELVNNVELLQVIK